MIRCKICNQEFKNISLLDRHIGREYKKQTHMSRKEYYLKYLSNENEHICKYKECTNETEFLSFSKGFRKYCSIKCRCLDEEYWNKYKDTMISKYGVEHPSKSENINEKKSNTIINNYKKNKKEIISKREQTCLNKYGVSSYFQTKEFKQNVHIYAKQGYIALKNKYNINSPMEFENVKEKLINSNIKKYGVKSTLELDEVKNKIKNTCLKKYGVDHISKSKEFRNICKLKYYNKLFNSNRLKNLVTPLFDIDEFKVYNDSRIKYKFKCNKCNKQFYDSLNNGRIPRCATCYPTNKPFSGLEKEICKFLDDNNVSYISNDKTILYPYELDIVLPNQKLAIEFNGLYWHSELNGGKNCQYHCNKTNECLKKNIQLIHIFEDEWIEKKDIVKSIILNKLRKCENKLYARNCKIQEIDNKIGNMFLNNNHLQSETNGSKYIGLIYNDELVSLIVYGKPRFNSKYEWEILRYCSKTNTSVIGGFSKLMKYFEKKYRPASIITYADRRYSDGNVYNINGFQFVKYTNPGYYYVDFKNCTRYNRMSFLKNNLKNKLKYFDESLTEWQNMQLNGYDRIWDCGNNVYEKKIGVS